MRRIYYLLVLVFVFSCKSADVFREADSSKAELLYQDDFDGELSNWKIEKEPVDTSDVYVQDGKMVIDVAGGATIWFKKKIKGDVLIQYERKVIMKNGENDRLSDLNQFWMATDPEDADLFTRSGSFRSYDDLRMYYAGIGGNRNTTTRFRKYPGNGERNLIYDLEDEKHLLKPDKTYLIQIMVRKGVTKVFVDGEEYFSYKDKNPLTQGYFGFRTVESHQKIDDFKVFRLVDRE